MDDVYHIDRQLLFQDVRRVVVKLGTRMVTVHDNALNIPLIETLAADIALLMQQGIQVAVVSSGAVGAGMGRLGLSRRPLNLSELQATASVGQGLLMNAYKLAFREHDIPVGQVLLTSEDFDNRRRYVNARNTLDVLFRYQAVPVINENDSVAVEELQLSVGENDWLSAMVAHMVDASLLVILTDVDGLYSDHPGRNEQVDLIPVVHEITPELMSRAGAPGSGVGQGGMATKLKAAKSVTKGGRMMVIANGLTTRMTDIVSGHEIGTLFLADQCRLTDRKLWIVNTRSKGAVVVDDGAVEALGARGKSLLPSGVLEVVGEFYAGELVGVEDRHRVEIARGLVRYHSESLKRILGKKTSEVASILNVPTGKEVIHRDDMVVF